MSGVALEHIEDIGAIAVLRLRDHGASIEIGLALAEAGLDVMEVTLDHPAALSALEAMADALPTATLLGAGTVRRPEQVRAAAAGGARFCVSPHVDAAVIEASLHAGVEPIPGAFTPTEVTTALDAGARLVKLFPAGPAGPDYLRALLGPFDGVRLVPTGGIGHDAVAPWIAAGATAVALGSDLVPRRPAKGEVAGVAERARVVVAQVAEARSAT